MNKENASEEYKKVRADRKEFKNFCRLNVITKKTFYELHCFAFRLLYVFWLRESNKDSEQFPAFSFIMDETRI